ncbi:MAG: MarR family transcriptional regulator [Clostridia bacterium]|nr:MarR family transcriptional regulator [Clostridia bacterium]
MRDRESITINDKNTNFKSTEMRLLTQVILAKYEGKRLISAQLAKLLGVTRSAISQIVNVLEARGVVVRVPDSIDKKIAYIELADGVFDAYSEDLEKGCAFADELVKEFGEEKFDTMCELYTNFAALVQKKIGMYEEK